MAHGGTWHWPAPVKVHFTTPKAGSTTPVIYWPEPFTISGRVECPPSCTFRAEERIRLTLTIASRGGVPTSSNAAADPEMKWLPFYRPTSSNLEGNSPKIAQLELLNQVHPKNLKGEKIKFKISGLQIHDWARNRVWGLNVVLERQGLRGTGLESAPDRGTHNDDPANQVNELAGEVHQRRETGRRAEEGEAELEKSEYEVGEANG